MTGIGYVLRDIPAPTLVSELTDALRLVRNAGGESLQLPSVAWLSPGLVPGELAAARDEASSRGVELTANLGVLNGAHPERVTSLANLGDGDVLRGIGLLARAARSAGIVALHATCGTLADRVDSAGAHLHREWDAQLSAHAALVGAAASILGDYGITLVLKTHEEMSSWDVLTVIFAAEANVRVGFSPVNLLVGMEDAIAAAGRLASLVHTVFLDDAALVRTESGVRRSMQALGDGVLNWPAIFAVLRSAATDVHVTLDLHRAQFDMPIYDPEWTTLWPDVPATELARLFGQARQSEIADADPQRRFERGRVVARSLAAREELVA
jgi:sugar phosphate isomerase/epimerase